MTGACWVPPDALRVRSIWSDTPSRSVSGGMGTVLVMSRDRAVTYAWRGVPGASRHAAQRGADAGVAARGPQRRCEVS